MATILVNGKKVTVDDSFLGLSPEEQNAAVDEIASQLGSGASATSRAAADDSTSPVTAPAASPPQAFSNPDEGSRFLRAAALTGSGVVKGFAELLGVPGDVESLVNSGTSALGLPGAAPGHFLPTSEDVAGVTDKLGLTDRPDLTPQNPVEGFGSAAAAGVGGGGPFGPVGVVSGIGGGVGAETAHTIAPNNPWAETVGGIVGGLAGGGLAQSVENLARSGDLPKAQAAVDAAQAATAQMAIDHGTAALAAKAAKDSGVAAAKAAADAHLAATQAPAQAAIAATASAIHPASTLQEAGTVLQGAAKDWVANEMPTRLVAAWSPVDALIPADSPVELSAFRSALGKINTSAGALEPLAARLKPSAPAALGGALKAVDEMGDLSGAGPTWADAQKLRTTLGDALSDPKIINDVGEQNLRQLYATLTADMRSTAAGQGRDALGAFDSANAQSSAVYNIAEGPLSKILNGDPNPEAVAKSLASGGKSGATDLTTIRQELPEGADALAATIVKQGGWQGLSPEAKAALVPDPALRASLDTAHATSDAAAASAAQLRSSEVAAATSQYNSVLTQQKTAMLAARQAVLRGQQTLALAKANAPTPLLKSAGTHIGVPIFGELAGEQLGHLLTEAFSLPESAGPTLALAGAGLPLAFNAARAIAHNPRIALNPAVGALTADANSRQPRIAFPWIGETQ